MQTEVETVNLTIWRLARGSVTVKTRDTLAKASASQWVVITHGRREHKFSDNALIESLSIHLDAGAARWTGPGVAVLADTLPLRRTGSAFTRVLEDFKQSGLCPPKQFFCIGSLLGHIEVQRRNLEFLGVVLSELEQRGIRLEWPDVDDPRVARTRHFLENLPLDWEWNRNAVAEKGAVSASQLDRLWRRQQNCTPFCFWEDRRLHFAKEKIENSGLQIKEIALQLGFTNLSQFSNWFRKRHGKSPRAYRDERRR